MSLWLINREFNYKALDNPKENILDKGGKIFVAVYKEEPLGVCAMIPMENSVRGIAIPNRHIVQIRKI